MLQFLSMLMSLLMIGLVGVLLVKNLIGLIEIWKTKKVAKQLRERALKGEEISLDNKK